MPLVPPLLEHRDYEELVDEALGRIPVHNPDWTDFNEGDPGVTLLQLFVFLTETLLWQIERRRRRRRRHRRRALLIAGAAAMGALWWAARRPGDENENPA